MHNMIKLIAHHIALPCTRPIQLNMILACQINCTWASHAPVQAHAWRTQAHAHTSFPLLASSLAINTHAWLHSRPTSRRLNCCTSEIPTSIKRNSEFFLSIFKFNFQLHWLIIELQFLNLASLLPQEHTASKNWSRSGLVKLHFQRLLFKLF